MIDDTTARRIARDAKKSPHYPQLGDVITHYILDPSDFTTGKDGKIALTESGREKVAQRPPYKGPHHQNFGDVKLTNDEGE